MVGIFPNEDAIVRLIGAILLKQNDDLAKGSCSEGLKLMTFPALLVGGSCAQRG